MPQPLWLHSSSRVHGRLEPPQGCTHRVFCLCSGCEVGHMQSAGYSIWLWGGSMRGFLSLCLSGTTRDAHFMHTGMRLTGQKNFPLTFSLCGFSSLGQVKVFRALFTFDPRTVRAFCLQKIWHTVLIAWISIYETDSHIALQVLGHKTIPAKTPMYSL